MARYEHNTILGDVSENTAAIRLCTLFGDCIVTKAMNNQLHDLEVRIKGETSIERVCRIQVKSTLFPQQGNKNPFYHVMVHHGAPVNGGSKSPYKEEDVDFFLLYLFLEGKFYVVPSAALAGKITASVYGSLPKPKSKKCGYYEKYLEAWEPISEFLGVPMDTEAATFFKIGIDEEAAN